MPRKKDMPPPAGELPDAIARYRRTGSSARKQAPREGLWRRVVGRISSANVEEAESDDGAGEAAARAAGAAGTGVASGTGSPPDHEQALIELALPGGERLLVAARAATGSEDRLCLELAPSPANSQELLAALAALCRRPTGSLGRPAVDATAARGVEAPVADGPPAAELAGSSDLAQLGGERHLAPSDVLLDEPDPGALTAGLYERAAPARRSAAPSDEQPAARGADRVRRGGAAAAFAPGATGQSAIKAAPSAAADIKAAPSAAAPASGAAAVPADRRAGGGGVAQGKRAVTIGIDFGTTNSAVAVLNGEVVVVPGEDGTLQIPSVVAFAEPGRILVGLEARARLEGQAHWTVTSPKRLLGKPFTDPDVASLVGRLALRSFAGADRCTCFEAHGQIFSSVDVCSLIIGALRQRASSFIGAEPTRVVLSVPVGFGSMQRSAMEHAVRQAGMDLAATISEPAASLLAHGLVDGGSLCVVYDFGGGTFDCSVVKVSEKSFEVLCSGGDPWLGGDELDRVLADRLAERFLAESGVDLRTRAVEWQRLLFACERAKRDLSTGQTAEVKLEDVLFTATGRKGLCYKVSRKELLGLVWPLIRRSITVTERVLAQAEISPREVHHVVMSGGTSLMPAVQDAVTHFFGKRPMQLDAELSVVRGAAIRAAELDGGPGAGSSGSSRRLRDVAGRTIGIGLVGQPPITLIERSTPLPAEAKHTFHTEHDGQSEIVIVLYEDIKSRLDETRRIGQLRYRGLRQAPAGQAQVDFTFRLDENGILRVIASVEGRITETAIKLGQSER